MNRFAQMLADMPIVQRILIILVAVLLIAAIVVGSVSMVLDRVRVNEMERRAALADPYEIERTRLERELSVFDTVLAQPIPGGATLTVAILGADISAYTNIKAAIDEVNETMQRDADLIDGVIDDTPEDSSEEEESEESESNAPHLITATVCLSPDELPDLPGKMTTEQLSELLSLGWKTAIRIKADDVPNLDEYLTAMEAEYASRGIAWCDTVCFDKFVYKTELDPVLKAHSISNIIDTVDEGEDLISQDLESDLWRVKADGWSLSKSKGSAMDNYNALVSSSGASVFLIEAWDGPSRESPTHYRPYDDDRSIINMFTTFSESIVNGDLYVDSVASARVRYADYSETLALRKQFYEPERQATLERLETLRAIIDGIYNGSIRDEEDIV